MNNVMPQVLWTRYFLEEKGYEKKDYITNQDNKSAILLANNRKALSSKRTRNINVRFFFGTDRAYPGDFSLQYCPMENMLGHFFTKPLQGAKFR